MSSQILYVDCFSGISGDMFLGALVDLGLPLETLRERLTQLPLSGYRLEARPRTSHGVSGTKLSVLVDESAQPERRLAEILALLEGSELSGSVRERTAAIFRRLAAAEAKIHGVGIDEVHFHEVGAVDSIVDVVGAAIGLEVLGLERVYGSSLPLAHGTIRTRHGTLPLPAPATLELIARVGAPTRPAPGQFELVTPTGAAILAELATWEQPPMRVNGIGYGFGSRELDWPNALRLWLGEPIEAAGPAPAAGPRRDQVVLIETNLDDASPELLGYAMERLFAAGALDVFFTSIQMKKNRPGTLLSVIAPPDQAGRLAELVIAETSTLGVRTRLLERLIAERREEVVETPHGAVRVKLKRVGDGWVAAPEYEDCARVARARGVPLAEVYRAALAAAPPVS